MERTERPKSLTVPQKDLEWRRTVRRGGGRRTGTAKVESKKTLDALPGHELLAQAAREALKNPVKQFGHERDGLHVVVSFFFSSPLLSHHPDKENKKKGGRWSKEQTSSRGKKSCPWSGFTEGPMA